MDTKPRRPKTSGAFLLATVFPSRVTPARRGMKEQESANFAPRRRRRGVSPQHCEPKGSAKNGDRASRPANGVESRGSEQGRTNRGLNPARRTQPKGGSNPPLGLLPSN